MIQSINNPRGEQPSNPVRHRLTKEAHALFIVAANFIGAFVFGRVSSRFGLVIDDTHLLLLAFATSMFTLSKSLEQIRHNKGLSSVEQFSIGFRNGFFGLRGLLTTSKRWLTQAWRRVCKHLSNPKP
jgi:uncharacterized membrane protein YfcA